ncbi:RfaF ADP-heptose,LPS heptosyltransferase [Candidatus Methylopumilus planktonicus]|uniref:glycosyltransferase family 9 protein n=1 Tax=Candidatus Methylopumilus planktonicus TaxID=1581557 RepID=UPI003BEF13F8
MFLKTKNIGDSIILTSAISALPKDYQYIDIVCLPESEPIFKMHPRVRHVFVIPRHLKGFSKVMAYIKFYQEITSYSYDLLAHFSNDWRGALLQRIFPAKLSVARRTHRRGQFWHQSFDILIESLDDIRPIAEQDVDLLRAVGLYGNVKAPSYLVKASINQKSKIKNWLSKHSVVLNKKLVVIHAPSRWKFKELPIATWANVIDKLKERKFEVVLCGSKEDLLTNQAIYALCKVKPIITNNFSLEDTAALYSLAQLVLTIDSMSTHLASATQTPVISIFGPSNERNWGPWGGKHSVIALTTENSPTFACRPCGKDGCEGSKISQCLIQMEPDLIINEALKMLR